MELYICVSLCLQILYLIIFQKFGVLVEKKIPSKRIAPGIAANPRESLQPQTRLSAKIAQLSRNSSMIIKMGMLLLQNVMACSQLASNYAQNK